MLGRWLFYLNLGRCELTRLWSATQHHVIIVAGICLPILMLLGLKRGHVETLRQDLITSPTGRQVTFWSAQNGELMDRESLARLENELPAVDVIIPETQRLVQISHTVDGEFVQIEAVTAFATRPGDPLLSQIGLSAPSSEAHDIIISRFVAEQLSAKAGDEMTLTLTRGRGAAAESVSLNCAVIGTIDTEEHESAIAYLDLDLLDQFDSYIRGYRVPRLGWASAKTSAPDSYSSYLVFCEVGHGLTDEDRDYLKGRGFQIRDLTSHPPEPLNQLLRPEMLEKLLIYEMHTELSHRDPKAGLKIAPSNLSEATSADDVVLPWNGPITRKVDNNVWQMVGLSLPRRTWLRDYFRFPQAAFDYEAEPLQFNTAEVVNGPLNWPLAGQFRVPLKLNSLIHEASEMTKEQGENATDIPSQENSEHSAEVSTDPAIRVGIVPANLLAWLVAERSGLVEFDPQIELFVPQLQPSVYDRARMYAQTIDDVPAVVEALANRKFAVMSETGRISEIHRQDESLQLLVIVVAIGVFGFGIVTVFSVLMDSTDRKRSTIGILRVMGMSRSGIFASILLRATIIGAISAGLSLLCGWGLSAFLGWSVPADMRWLAWKPTVFVALDTTDLIIVALGAMLCCCLGAIPPAWKASRLDPFDAIIEGRFR